MLATRRLALCAVLGTAVSAFAQPAELKRVHALLVIDTVSNLKESVEIDGERISEILVRGLSKEHLGLTKLEGKEVTRERILAYYRNLKAEPNDALLFFYAGHGAIDPTKGHFFALQSKGGGLPIPPLLRSELRQAMAATRSPLTVILTDCCSDRYVIDKSGSKKRGYQAGEAPANRENPLLRQLLLRQRGIVDVTASTGNVAFGDEQDGGIFTRNLARLLQKSPTELDTNKDGLVQWSEFFPRLQKDTEATFVTWRQKQRSLGDDIDQAQQRPRAFELPGGTPKEAVGRAVTIRNPTTQPLTYQFRWSADGPWQKGTVPANGERTHEPPAGARGNAGLEVQFDGEQRRLEGGKAYNFRPNGK